MTMFERFFVLPCYWHMNMYLYISPSTLPHWVVCISHCVCIVSLIENLIVKYIVTWICSISSIHQPQGHNNGWWFLMNVLNYNLLANQAVCDHNMQTIYHQCFLKDTRKKKHFVLFYNLTAPSFFSIITQAKTSIKIDFFSL